MTTVCDNGSIKAEAGKVVITLDLDGAEWLLSQLPYSDQWTGYLAAAIMTAAALQDKEAIS